MGLYSDTYFVLNFIDRHASNTQIQTLGMPLSVLAVRAFFLFGKRRRGGGVIYILPPTSPFAAP